MGGNGSTPYEVKLDGYTALKSTDTTPFVFDRAIGKDWTQNSVLEIRCVTGGVDVVLQAIEFNGETMVDSYQYTMAQVDSLTLQVNELRQVIKSMDIDDL